MVEVNCETDFVARNQDFQEFVREIAMQVAASNPLYISREEVPNDVIEKEKEIELEKIKGENKPKEVVEKIIEGKMEKFYQEICLLDQEYIKDPNLKIKDLLNDKLASIGEKITISKIARFEITGSGKSC